MEKTEKYFFTKINNRIISVCRNIEGIKTRLPEIVVFILWSVIHFFVSVYHERWFDEAVAWQIAKNSTIHDLLLRVPHYEGHVPFWHLRLRPFAKSGAPYSFSLGLITYIFMEVSDV